MKIIVGLLGLLLAAGVYAQTVVDIAFERVKNFDNSFSYCPRKLTSKRSGQERYCKKNSRTQGDAVCVEQSGDTVTFSGRPRHQDYRFKVVAKPGTDTIVCASPNYEYVHNCVVTDTNSDKELSYTVETLTCDYDPRIIITNAVLVLDSDEVNKSASDGSKADSGE